MSGIGVVLNPHSKSNRRNPERIRRLAFIVGDKGSCHATQDLPDLHEVAQEFAQRDIEVLGISGGDGTIHHTISAFLDVYGERPLPKIALLRGGTVNNVAGAIGIQGTPEAILSRLIVRYHEDTPFDVSPVHCMHINGKHGFLFGTGLVSNFIAEYIRVGEGGARNVFFLIARMVASGLVHTRYMLRLCRRFDAQVTVDGVLWPYKNYVVVEGGTVEPYGFGFRPFVRAREKVGHFHLIGFSMPPRQVLPGLIPAFLGKPSKSEHYLESVAREVVVELAEPHRYMIDGELYPPTTRLEVRCGPALQMIRV